MFKIKLRWNYVLILINVQILITEVCANFEEGWCRRIALEKQPPPLGQRRALWQALNSDLFGGCLITTQRASEAWIAVKGFQWPLESRAQAGNDPAQEVLFTYHSQRRRSCYDQLRAGPGVRANRKSVGVFLILQNHFHLRGKMGTMEEFHSHTRQYLKNNSWIARVSIKL